MKNTSRVIVWVAIIWGIALGLAIWIILIMVSQPTQNIEPLAVAPLTVTFVVPSTTQPPALTQTKQPSILTAPASQTPHPTASHTISATPIPSRTRPSSLTPGPARPTVIGYSVAGRPLEVYRFGRGDTERLIVAGIHGGYEWNTIALADELIEYLNQNPDMIPSDTRLYILRAFNPDGAARSQSYDGRANENGVDLNRNFPSLWQENWSRDGCWDYGPITAGPNPASEPETQALMKFVLNHNIETLISYHSAALGIFPGGQPPDSASIDLAETIASVSTYPYPPMDTGCMYSGQLIDWASNLDIASVDIELSDHANTDFEQNVAILREFLRWKK